MVAQVALVAEPCRAPGLRAREWPLLVMHDAHVPRQVVRLAERRRATGEVTQVRALLCALWQCPIALGVTQVCVNG